MGSEARRRLGPLFLALVVLATRLPFLGPGYGLDPDAWRLALASRRIAAGELYSLSRPPGYPLVEYGGALLVGGGAPALNGASALACVAASLGVAQLARRLRPGAALPAALAFAFAPVVYVASVSAMDYMWAAALLLGALVAAERDRPALAGVALGLAVGARAGSALFLLPVAWLLARGSRGPRGALVAATLSIAIGALAYAPVLASHELDRLAPTRGDYPPLTVVLARAGPESLGLLGAAACGLGLVLALARRRPPAQAAERRLRAALWIGLAASLALFAWMPLEAGYLIPTLALALPLLVSALPGSAGWALAVLVALGAFVEPRAGGLAPGPVPRDHAERVTREERLDRILAAARSLPPPAVVVAGPWVPRLAYELEGAGPRGYAFTFVVTPRDVELAREWRRSLHHLAEIEPWHASVTGHSLPALGSLPLVEEAPPAR